MITENCVIHNFYRAPINIEEHNTCIPLTELYGASMILLMVPL